MSLKFTFKLLLLFSGILFLTACDKELEVQTNFPFELSVMPIPKYIDNAETVEIRCQILPGSTYNGTTYFIRYFQNEGQGYLSVDFNKPLILNDSYPLKKQTFRLYYTALSGGPHSFDVWVSDNFGNEKMVSFEFEAAIK